MRTSEPNINRYGATARARSVEFGAPVLPLAAAATAFSCSRYFGLPKIVDFPDITAERTILIMLCAFMAIQIVVHRMHIWNLRLTEMGLWFVALMAGVSGIAKGGFLAGYAGGGPEVLLKFVVIPAILFAAIIRTKLSGRRFTVFMIVLTGFGIYLGATAIAEKLEFTWALIPPEIGDPMIDQHWGRARGPFLQAEFNGTVMAMLVPIMLVWTSMKDWLLRLVGFFVAVLLCLGCYLTDTRAALLSAAVIIVCGSIFAGPVRKSYRALLLMLSLSAAILAAFGKPLVPRLDEIEPVTARLQLLSATLGMIGAHPITGVGFVNFDHLQAQYFDPKALGDIVPSEDLWEGGTHNSLLTPIAELGILVGGVYIALVARVVLLGFRNMRLARVQFGEKTALLTCGILMAIAFVINAMLVELRFTLTPNALFWIGAAFIEGSVLRERSIDNKNAENEWMVPTACEAR